MSLSITDVVVEIPQGRLRGAVTEGVASFKGIPYAAAPFGANRFKAPQPAPSWDGMRDALAYGPTVPKPPYFPPFDEILPEPVIEGEECLNLNIWTPDAKASGLPVMVWIHGGAFANGAAAVPQYDGRRFARDGVVLVSINYRLGVDGFLFLDDGVANLGLLDQVAALEWVKDNIAAFGGDKANVTIFGESAGGMSVATLLSMPRAKGLFKRVIAESGAGHHALSAATAKRVGGYLAEKLGVPANRAAIAAAPVAQAYQAQVAMSADAFLAPDPAKWGEVAGNLMPFEPVIDGHVVPVLPIEGIAAGAGAGVDLLVGTNREEQRLFMVPSGAIDHIDENILGMAVAGYRLPANAIELYSSTRPGATPGELLAAISTDWFFRIPAVRLAEAHSRNGGSAHVYEMAWRSPLYGGRLGACHALEIGFVFDNLDADWTDRLAGPNPPQSIADEMHRAWVAFARTGDPGWESYDAGRRTVMRFDSTSGAVDDPESGERLLWEGIR
ncbi:MAG TPA: carboxylesterase family protein [Candidatus Dormibacteraeota bacterium]